MNSSLPYAPPSLQERVRQGYLARLRELIQADWTRLELLKDDPMLLAQALWPTVSFYDRQQEIIESVRDNDETVCVAGHQLGKDFVSGFVALWYFLTNPVCRVITTSVKDDHLRVLWSEINRFIEIAAVPLTHDKGGPLILHHRDIKKMNSGVECPVSYLRGMVSERGEGLAGHHAPTTLAIFDEASGCEDAGYERCTTWAKRILIIGNPYPCTNFFYKGVKGGDITAR